MHGGLHTRYTQLRAGAGGSLASANRLRPDVDPDQFRPGIDQLLENLCAVSDDRQIDSHDLVDRAAINVDVDFGGIGRERIELAGHPVIKPRANGNDQVRLIE